MADTQPLEPTDAEIDAFVAAYLGDCGPQATRVYSFVRAVLAKWGTPAGAERLEVTEAECEAAVLELEIEDLCTTPQPTQAQAGAVPLTPREIELLDGMIAVQLDHAMRCDAIANRAMADKQKGWDMERVALLQKFKVHGIKGGQHGADTRSN